MSNVSRKRVKRDEESAAATEAAPTGESAALHPLTLILAHPDRRLLFKMVTEMCGSEAAVTKLCKMIYDLIPTPNFESVRDSDSDRAECNIDGRSSKALNTPALRIVRAHYLVNSHPRGEELKALVQQVAGVTSDRTESELQFPVSNYFRQRRWHAANKARRLAEAQQHQGQHAAGEHESMEDAASHGKEKADATAPVASPSRHRILHRPKQYTIVRPPSVLAHIRTQP